MSEVQLVTPTGEALNVAQLCADLARCAVVHRDEARLDPAAVALILESHGLAVPEQE